MNIRGEIKGIKYKPLLSLDLLEIDIDKFDINKVPSVFLIKDNKYFFAVSKWVSPKRTRSYPFERVYNMFYISKKITVIPIVKDEGEKGDRDYIQWDTVSLMSLLDVFVIFAYYDTAEISPTNKQKITNQQFSNEYVISKIKEIEQYHSSALHWNLHELNTNFHKIIDRVKESYTRIETETGVKLHNVEGLKKFQTQVSKDVSSFMSFSRDKAEQAQKREFLTLQPKESLSTSTKAKITITNYLGGQYFLTVDEILFEENIIYLIEGKHSKNTLIPSINDIKDGLLKMILYSNLSEVIVSGNRITSKAVLCLTSPKLKGKITSNNTQQEITSFFRINNFSISQMKLIETLIKEAQQNNFVIKIQFLK